MRRYSQSCAGKPEFSSARRWLLNRGVLSGAALAGLRVAVAGTDGIQVGVAENVLSDYRQLLDGRVALTVQEFRGPHASRDVVELFMLEQALARGGWDRPIELMPLPSSRRIFRELDVGHVACGGTTHWGEDFASRSLQVSLSDAVVRRGEFEVGFYAVPTNAHAMRARNLSDLRQLRALSCRYWTVDWKALARLDPRELLEANNFVQIARMLDAGRADFTLAPFRNSPGLSIVVGGVTLQPIPGLKLALKGTRHFMVANRHRLSAEVHDRLNVGLQHLHERQWIRNAYTQCGFFNERVARWGRVEL